MANSGDKNSDFSTRNTILNGLVMYFVGYRFHNPFIDYK